MTHQDILNLVIEETNISFDKMVQKYAPETTLFARYVAISFMIEEGISAKLVANIFNMFFTNMKGTLSTIDNLLKYNSEFKAMYIACGIRRVEMEETV